MTSIPNFPDNTTNLCVSVNPKSSLIIVVFPILQVLINVFVIIAVLQSRRSLRHNFVYLYVINLLAANVIFGIFSMYHFLVYNTDIEAIHGHPNSDMLYEGNRTLKQWWTFRSGFLCSLYLIMSGSLSALIYGIRESSYFVGKTSIHFSKRSQRLTSSTSLKNSSTNLFRMLLIIFLVWFLPTLLTIAATAGWNCADHCYCTHGNFGRDVYFCHSDVIRYCSRFYQPHRNEFLIVVVVVWVLQSLGIIYMNWSTLKKYTEVTRRSAKSSAQSGGNVMSLTERNKKDEAASDIVFVQRKPKSCLPSLNRNMKLLLILSVTFILSTLPIMLTSLVDIASPSYVLSYVATVGAFMLVTVYCSVCPILLVCYMAGLRKAVGLILFRCCTTTVTTKHSSSVSGERSDVSSMGR